MARHRSPRGRRASWTLPFPLVGTAEGESGAHRAPSVPVLPVAVPAPVRRGAAIAVAAGGVLSVAGAAVAVIPDDAPAVSAPAAVALASERGTVAVPLPGAALAVPDPAADAPPPVLDGAQLSRAVERAQTQARDLATRAREGADTRREQAARAAEKRTQDARDAAAKDARDRAEAADEARRTAERAGRAGRAAEPEAGTTAPAAGCGLDTSALGAVKAHVRAAAQTLGCAFGEPEVLGIAGRGGPSDHPQGRALDFMVDRATGDRLAACAVRNREALGVSYVIWRQRIDTGSGFRAMPDRGGATANHLDHVHVSFERGAPGGPVSC